MSDSITIDFDESDFTDVSASATKVAKSDKKAEDSEKALAKIVKLMLRRAKLWHDKDGAPFASFKVGRHLEHWRLDSRAFKDFIIKTIRANPQLKIGAIGKQLTEEVLLNLSAEAVHGGEELKTRCRVAQHGDVYYIDLCDEAWRLVEISSEGWQILDTPPEVDGKPAFIFVRSANSRPLPQPVEGGSVGDLFKLCNIPEDDYVLALAWILECFRPDTPYPVLEITGEQGSAKSTTQGVLRSFVDPNRVMLRAKPKTVEDIFIAAANSHLVSYENLSTISADMSDALCVISTGGGFAARMLYTNGEEHLLEAHAPIVINGINKIAIRPDLVDRVVSIDLPRITERLDEAAHEKMVESLSPGIFGAILTLFANTLKMLPLVNIDSSKLPRMADFAKLGEAMSQAMGGPAGVFLDFYVERRRESVLNILESSPVARAIGEFVNVKGKYIGTVHELLEGLNAHRGFFEDDAFWPKSPKGLANEMRRLSPALAQIGIICDVIRRTKAGVLCEVAKKSDC